MAGYKIGDRVRVLDVDDPYHHFQAGIEGVITHVSDWGFPVVEADGIPQELSENEFEVIG